MFVLGMVSKHNPPEIHRYQSVIMLSPFIALPVIGVSSDVYSVTIEAGVTVGSQGTASSHTNCVHVIPVTPVGSEPSKPQFSNWNNKLPAS